MADRGAITDNSEAANVVKVWKSFVLDDAVGVNVDAVGAIFNESDKTRVPKMCRKCFLAYKKYSNSSNLLQDNLYKAVVAPDLVASTSILQTPPSQRGLEFMLFLDCAFTQCHAIPVYIIH